MPKVSRVVGDGEKRPLLHGSDVADAGRTGIAGVILEARVSPTGFGSPFIIDFDADVLPGIRSWSVNVTNARKLGAMISDKTEDWAGWGVILAVVEGNNPQQKKSVPTLEVARVVTPAEIQKTRKSKPKYKTVAQTGGITVKDSDITF